MKFVEKLFLKDLRITARIVLSFFMTLGLLIFLIHGLIVVGFKYPLDYGEGPLLNQALRIVQNKPLYPQGITEPPYLISNYPPVYVLINGLFVSLFGPILAIGRLISFLSTLGSALMIALITRHFSAKKQYLPMLTGASIFLIIPYVLEWSPLFRIDMLGLFLSLSGLYVAVRDPQKNRNMFLSAALFILAAYTRQSYGLAAPLAAMVFIFSRNKYQALKFFLTYALGGLAIFGLLSWITDGAFFFHIITANVNPFRWATVWDFAKNIWQKMPLILILAGAYLALGWRLGKSYLVLCPYILASALAALTIGKVGSNINYLVEISASLALLMGIIISHLTETLSINPDIKPELDFSPDEIPAPEDVPGDIRSKLWINLAVFFVLTAILTYQVARLSRESLFGPIANHRDRIKQGGNDYAFLEETIRQAAEVGPVLADEFMAMLPMNRIPLTIQPFEMTQLAFAGLWDQTPFVNAIAQKEFPLILIHHFQTYPVYLERWTTEMLDAIFEGYVAVEMRANSLLFEPKDTNHAAYPENLECPGVPFKLPTQANMGMYWKDGQLLMLGAGCSGEIPVYAVADGLLYQFPGWETAVAIQHEDPLKPDSTIWSFYGDLAPAFDRANPFIEAPYLNANGVPVKTGDLIGYQGRWLGPSQQTWVHLRFTLLPSTREGDFPESFLPIEDFNADLPGVQEQERLGLDTSISLPAYTGLPESEFYGVLDFLPFMCETEGE